MGNTSGAKIKHMFYNPSWGNVKSGKKLEKATQRYVDIKMKEAKQGETKWIKKTMVKCQARVKKYGIPQALLDEKVAKKSAKKVSSI